MTITPSPLDVLAAGGHHLLLHGHGHGSLYTRGRTVLARLIMLLPDLDDAELAEVAALHDAAREPWPAQHRRPPITYVRSWLSPAALLGGGSPARPGEVSLAHRGLLVLFDLPGYPREDIDRLCEQVEYDRIRVNDGRPRTYPARFTLLATMTPCPCGWLGHHERPCTCSPEQVREHRARVSGLVPERVDLIAPIDTAKSRTSRATIELARARARRRLAGTGCLLNGQIPAHDCEAIERLCPVSDGESLLALGRARGWSRTALARVRRVARTIADLQIDRDPNEPLGADVISEAIRLRADFP